MAVQEFQWARSLFTVLLDIVPHTITRLPWTLRVRFLSSLLYYPLLVGATLADALLPTIACLRGEPWVAVHYGYFLLGWLTPTALLLLVTLLLRRRGLLRPPNSKVIGWELWLYVFYRWVFAAWGVAAALLQRVRPQQVTFKITPKQRSLGTFPGRFVLPFAVITAATSAGNVVGLKNPDRRGSSRPAPCPHHRFGQALPPQIRRGDRSTRRSREPEAHHSANGCRSRRVAASKVAPTSTGH